MAKLKKDTTNTWTTRLIHSDDYIEFFANIKGKDN